MFCSLVGSAFSCDVRLWHSEDKNFAWLQMPCFCYLPNCYTGMTMLGKNTVSVFCPIYSLNVLCDFILQKSTFGVGVDDN